MRTLPALAFIFMTVGASAARGDDEGLIAITMTPARDAGVAWSRRSIRRLDGARVVLPGAGKVAAVALRDDGTVFAIRGRSRFGVAGPGAAAVWRNTPVAGKTRGLVVLADQVAWIFNAGGGDKLALTADQGRHWTVQNLPYVDHGRLELRAGGVLELVGYMENCHSGDYSVVYRGRVGSNRWREVRTGPETAFGEPTHYGSWNGDGDQPVGSDVVDDKRVLDAPAPDGLTTMGSDSEGRPLGVTSNNVWRWSEATGWQALWPLGH